MNSNDRQAGQNVGLGTVVGGVKGLVKAIKIICAKLPFQLPFGILREDSDVTEFTSESKSLVAQDKLEPFCLGLCKLTYIFLWIFYWPLCQFLPPFGR